LAILVLDRSNAMRLNRYAAKAEEAKKSAMTQMELRFAYARQLSFLAEEKSISLSYDGEMTIADLSAAYNSLDSALSAVQKELYQKPDHLLYLAYYEKMYACETDFEKAVALYNDAAEYFNTQSSAFPARLTSKRLGLDPLEVFTVSTSLKSRP
jgi:tetratricopeptide (TPR) repeat protein